MKLSLILAASLLTALSACSADARQSQTAAAPAPVPVSTVSNPAMDQANMTIQATSNKLITEISTELNLATQVLTLQARVKQLEAELAAAKK